MTPPTPEDDLTPDEDGLVRRSWAIGGAALSALEGGSAAQRGGQAPPLDEVVVLLHGIPASAELWRGVMTRLVDAGHHVVAFDLPGYGDTLLPARTDHSLAGAAELISAWMRINLGRGAWLVGHDLGGAVAQIVVSRHPTMLSRLSLADTVFEDSWPVPPVRALRVLARTGLYPVLGSARLLPTGVIRRELRRGFADQSRLTPELLDRVFFDGKVRDDAGRRAFVRHLVALDPFQTTAAAGSLSRVPCPTQLVWGTRDVMQPWDQVGVALEAALPDPEVALLEGVGHFSPAEDPAAFARALLDWRPATTE